MPIQRYKFDGVDLVKNHEGRWIKYNDYVEEERSLLERLIVLVLYCRPEIMASLPEQIVLTKIFLASAEIYNYLLHFDEIIKNIYGSDSAIYEVIIKDTKKIVTGNRKDLMEVKDEDLIQVYEKLKKALYEIEGKYSKTAQA